jgi:hypothetical protein
MCLALACGSGDRPGNLDVVTCISTTTGGVLRVTEPLVNSGGRDVPLSVEPTCPLEIALGNRDDGGAPFPPMQLCMGARHTVAPGDTFTLAATRDAGWLAAFPPGSYNVITTFTTQLSFKGELQEVLAIDLCGQVTLPLQ